MRVPWSRCGLGLGFSQCAEECVLTSKLTPTHCPLPPAQDDLRTALLAYFKVGQPGGKTLQRFDELMQVRCRGGWGLVELGWEGAAPGADGAWRCLEPLCPITDLLARLG